MGPFGALLATALAATLAVGGFEWLSARALDERVRLAGRQLTVLADATAGYVDAEFPALLAAAQGGPSRIAIADLRAAGVLPAGWRDVDALGRRPEILMLADGADAVRIAVAQRAAAGDAIVPSAALFADSGGVRLGLVPPEAPTRLRGPLIDLDMSAFQAAFAGAPAANALAAFSRHDHATVYGDALYRTAISGFPAANRMETALDMGGNDVANAGAVTADSLAIARELEVQGDLTAAAGLTVGAGLAVGGAAAITGRLTAGDARVSGAVAAASLSVSGDARVGSLTAAGAARASSARIAGVLAAGSVRATRLSADRVAARSVRATGSANVASTVRARSVLATGTLSAASGVFANLAVGSCSGC